MSRASHFRPILLGAAFLAGAAACGGAPSGEDAAPRESLAADTDFAAMQERGREVMGVDQYRSTHHFDDLDDGGRIVLLSDSGDSSDVAAIRAHLRGIADAFARGDFRDPSLVHMRTVPGTPVMAAKAALIAYAFAERPRGGEVRIRTSDPAAVAAIHEFLAFQRDAHHAHEHDIDGPQSLACPPVDGSEAVLEPGNIVLVGEVHGTQTSPSTFGRLVCTALDTGQPVTAALEIYEEEGTRIDRYLASEGSEADRDALLAGPFWHEELQDGRRSEAMLELLDSLRARKQAGAALRILLLDSRSRLDADLREQRMAERLRDAAAARPSDIVLSLTGNIHSRTRTGTPWDPHFRPMGLRLENLLSGRRVIGLDVAHSGGTAWICSAPDPSSCRPHAIAPSRGYGPTAGSRIVLDGTLQSYDGYVTVGPLQASPPAAPAT